MIYILLKAVSGFHLIISMSCVRSLSGKVKFGQNFSLCLYQVQITGERLQEHRSSWFLVYTVAQ